MNHYFKANNVLPLVAVLFATNLLAQSKVVATQTDDKFAQTTVVYKNEGGIDAEVLAQLEGSYGISDVVRIAVGTPQPKSVTVPLTAPVHAFIVPTTPAVLVNDLLTRHLVASDDIAVVLADSRSTTAAETLAFTPPVNNLLADVTSVHTLPDNNSFSPQYQENVRVVTTSTFAKTYKTTPKVTTSKSVKKSRTAVKKSTPAQVKKFRKKGKQRYGCFRF